MMQRGLIIGSLLVYFTAVPTVIVLGSSGPITVNKLLATSKAPAQYCASHEPGTLRALKQGDKREVVVVKAFQPVKPPGAGLVISLLTANRTKRHEITRFAVHPLRAFTMLEPKRHQRFLVSLTEQAQLIADGQPLCLEVGFDTSRGKPVGGMAEIDIELVDITSTQGK